MTALEIGEHGASQNMAHCTIEEVIETTPVHTHVGEKEVEVEIITLDDDGGPGEAVGVTKK